MSDETSPSHEEMLHQTTKYALILDNRPSDRVTSAGIQLFESGLTNFGYTCIRGNHFTVQTRETYEEAIRQFCETPGATDLCIALLGYATMWGPTALNNESIDLPELIEQNLSATQAPIRLFLLFEPQNIPIQPQADPNHPLQNDDVRLIPQSLSRFLNSPNLCQDVTNVMNNVLENLTGLPHATFNHLYVFISLLPLSLFHDDDEALLDGQPQRSVVLDSVVQCLRTANGRLEPFLEALNSQLFNQYGLYEEICPKSIPGLNVPNL